MKLEEFEMLKDWVDNKVRLMIEISKLNPYDVHRCMDLSKQLEHNDKMVEDFLKKSHGN